MNARITEIRARKQALDEAAALVHSTRAALDLMIERLDLLTELADALCVPVSFPTEAEEGTVAVGHALRIAVLALGDDLSPHNRRLRDVMESLRRTDALIESDLYSERGAA